MSLLRLVPGVFLAGRFRDVGLNVNQRSFSQTECQVLQVFQQGLYGLPLRRQLKVKTEEKCT